MAEPFEQQVAAHSNLVRPNEVLTIEGNADGIRWRFCLRSEPSLVISQQMSYLQADMLRIDPVDMVLTICRRKMLEALDRREREAPASAKTST